VIMSVVRSRATPVMSQNRESLRVCSLSDMAATRAFSNVAAASGIRPARRWASIHCKGQQALAFSGQQARDGQCGSERINGRTVEFDLHGCDAGQRRHAMQIAGDGGRNVASLLRACARGGRKPGLLLGIGHVGERDGDLALPWPEGDRLQGSSRLQGLVEGGHGLADQTGARLGPGYIVKLV
jgi:hypothetical protein